MAGVKFQSIYKTYENKVKVIEDLNLEIFDGEFLVLVGPSGCGKSTALRMIAGLEEISQGDLFIGERRVNNLPPRERNIAMVFQNYALYPHMTVRDNMGFSLKLAKMPRDKIKQQVDRAAKILELELLLERKPRQLSGGQRQRVAIGRAIVRNPEVFLFDEPLSNLDAKLRGETRVELAKLHKQLKSTIVYVTHDQVEAMTLADRIVVLKDGKAQQVGTPLELYEKPINSFVGGFIGTPTMNQLPAKLSGRDPLTIEGKGISIVLPSSVASFVSDDRDREILLGIRPQDLSVQESDTDTPSIQAVVEVIEPMGSESYIHFTIDNKQWVARQEGLPRIKEGEKINISVNIDKLHIFSIDGNKRLN